MADGMLALDLVLAGADVKDVAKQIGEPPAAVRKLVLEQLGLDSSVDAEAERRAVELARLNQLQLGVWGEAVRGETYAIEAVLKIIGARLALGGVSDMPGPQRAAFNQSVATLEDKRGRESLIALGSAIADRIDQALAFGQGQEVTKALYLGPHLVNILNALGLGQRKEEEGEDDKQVILRKLQTRQEDRKLRALA